MPNDDASVSSLISEFLGVVAHRVHTPITRILWLTESLADGSMGDLTDDQKESLNSILESAESLNEFSRTMLYVYELEKDMPMLKMQDIPFGDLLVRVTRHLESLLKEKKISIVCDQESKSVSIHSDLEIASTVLRSLLENAIRYSHDNAEILLSVRQKEEGIIITVEDHGIGIPSQLVPMIGQKFFRAPEAKKIWTDGVGLSLYITKNLIERTGGKFSFESEQKKGSSFHWCIPTKVKRKQAWE